jgi:hypothetical protein
MIRDLAHYARETIAAIMELLAIGLFALFLIGLAAYSEGIIQ